MPRLFILSTLLFIILSYFLFRNDPFFEKNSVIRPDLYQSTDPYQPKSEVIFHGPRDKKVVALTFDADMTPGMRQDLEKGRVKTWYNKKIIEILIQNKVPATIFMSGIWIEVYPKETKELAKNRLFELANHSYSHPAFEAKCYNLTFIQDSKDEAEILKTQKLLKDVAGVNNHFFRFPGGCYEKGDVDIVHKLGLDVIGWDAASGDSFNPNTQNLINNVAKTAQNGSIILMHLQGPPNAPKTAEALPEIIKGLKDRGFSFVKVSEMIK